MRRRELEFMAAAFAAERESIGSFRDAICASTAPTAGYRGPERFWVGPGARARDA